MIEDPVTALAVLLDIRRTLRRVVLAKRRAWDARERRGLRDDRVFLQLLISRLSVDLGLSRELVAAALPAVHFSWCSMLKPKLNDYPDLPPSHYREKAHVMDQLAASILVDYTAVTLPEVREIEPTSVDGHILCDVLVATRVYGSQALGALRGSLPEVRRLLQMYEEGRAWSWHAGYYAREIKRLTAIEVAYFAAFR